MKPKENVIKVLYAMHLKHQYPIDFMIQEVKAAKYGSGLLEAMRNDYDMTVIATTSLFIPRDNILELPYILSNFVKEYIQVP